MLVSEFIDRLRSYGSKVSKSGKGFVAQCPAHEDRKASLTISSGDKGVVVNCHAGCASERVVHALGLTMADLFYEECQPEDREARAPRRIVATYEYTDETGKVLYRKHRYVPKDFRFEPAGPPRRVLYRLHELQTSSVCAFLVEGEKDADALCARKLKATTVDTGAKGWRDEYAPCFARLPVVIIPDNDEQGRAFAEKAAASIKTHALSVKVLHLPGLAPKGDVSDWLASGGTVAELLRLADACPEWGTDVYGCGVLEYIGEEEPEDDDESDFHIVGLLARAVPGVFGGDPKTAKTLIMEDMAISLALGESEWCGFKITGRSRVLLMPREDSRQTTAKRIWQMCRARGIHPRELEGWLRIDGLSPFFFDDPGFVYKFRRTLERMDVAFVDSLSTVHRGDENSAKDMGVIATAWREASITDGKSVALLHHFGQGKDKSRPGAALRGSTAIYAHLRHVLGVQWANEERTELELRADGNLSHRMKPTLIRLCGTTLPDGKKTLRFEYAGTTDDRDGMEIDKAILAVLRDKDDGLSARDLRTAVREYMEGKHCRNGTIDEAAIRLSREGRIRRTTSKSPWKMVQH